MVAVHMQDKAYMESSTARQLMKDLFDNSQVMSNEVVDYSQPLLLQGDLWDPMSNTANPEFAEHGYDYWSFDSLDQKMISGHPIIQWPWPHADLFLLFSSCSLTFWKLAWRLIISPQLVPSSDQ